MMKIKRNLLTIIFVICVCYFVQAGTVVYAEESSLTSTDGNWQYRLADNSDGGQDAIIEKYVGSTLDPIIPEKIDEQYKVIKLDDEAFVGTNITAVEFSGCIDIGNKAFYQIASLKTVTVDSHVKNPETDDEYFIGEYAFSGCSSLETVQIPKGIVNLNTSAFYLCEKLTAVTIPDTVKYIGRGCFSNCSALTGVVLPDSVEELGNNAFYSCSALETVTLSKNLQTLETATFKLCASLKNVTIPGGVTELEGELFSGCEKLETVVIPNSVTEIYQIGHDLFIDCPDSLIVYVEKDTAAMEYVQNENAHVNYVMVHHATSPVYSYTDGWQYMKYTDENNDTEAEIVGYIGGDDELTVPDSIAENMEDGSVQIPVTSVASYVFKDKSITELSLPNSVVRMGEAVCKDCTSLEVLNLSNALTEIPESAFEGCTSLKDFTTYDKLTRIADNAFRSCEALSDFSIPSDVCFIGSHAFDGCTKLQTVSFAKREDTSKEFEMREYAFANCDLQSVTLPKGATDVPEYGFYNNVNLTGVTMPEGIRIISSYAFSGCEKLSQVKIPSTVTHILEHAFDTCKSINEIEIPNSVTNIDYAAFSDCSALEKATILSNVKYIQAQVFYNCDNLTIYTEKDSVAEAYAKENTIKYVIIGEPFKDPNTQQPTTQQPSSKENKETDETEIPSVGKVKKFKAIAKNKSLVLSWKKSKNISGYQIEISTKKTFKKAKTYTIKKAKTKQTVSKLKSKTKYYIRIRAFANYEDQSGKTKRACGKWVIIKKKTK